MGHMSMLETRPIIKTASLLFKLSTRDQAVKLVLSGMQEHL